MTVTIVHRNAPEPLFYTVGPDDDLVVRAGRAVGEPLALDADRAVELVVRCVQVLAGQRSVPIRDRNVHPGLLAVVKAAAGSRVDVRGCRVRAVRVQREASVVRLAGVLVCGARGRAFTAEFRPTGSGWWLTHLGVV